MSRLVPSLLALFYLALVALASVIAVLWARRRVQETQALLSRMRDEQEALVARYDSLMKGEVTALEGRMAEERRRTAKELAQLQLRSQHDVARWRRIALGVAAEATVPLDYPDRPSARDLLSILERLRGVAFLDSAVIADDAGLILCGDETPSARELATLVPGARLLVAALPGAVERAVAMTLVCEDGRYVSLRSLPGWTQGAWLVATTVGQPPSALAMDAAVGHALLRDERAGAGGASSAGALRGASGVFGDNSIYGQRLVVDMGSLLSLTGFLAVAVAHKGQMAAAVLEGGPPVAQCGRLCGGLEQLRGQASWHLHAGDVVRIDVTLEEGLILTYAPLQAGSQVSMLVVAEGRVPSNVHLMALAGRVRRLLAHVPPPVPAPMMGANKLQEAYL